MVQELNFQQPSNVIRFQDRLPPQNLDAEMNILGGCLVDQNAIARIADILVPEAFYVGGHREIYRAMLAMHAIDEPVDLMTVFTWLNDRGLLDRIGGKAKLAELMDTPSAVNIDHYANLVMEKYRRRQLIAIGQEIVQMGSDTTTDLESICNMIEQKVFSATQQQQQKTVAPAADIVLSVFEEIQQREAGESFPGLTCGFYDLDAMTQGFQRSDLVIVAGRPSMGKTSFTLNVAETIATFHKAPVLFFSLETSKEKLISRMVSSNARIEQGRLRAGRITPDDWSPLGRTIGKISDMPIWVDDQASATVQHMRSTARWVQSQAGMPLGMILIDYLQLMGGNGDNRVQELSAITRELKGLAKELNVPVIALSQLSRAVESRTNKRPMMSDLRESGAIEQDADLIMMLYRDEYYNPETCDRGIAEIIISKHRDGPTGTVKLLFEPQFTQFRNLAAPGRL